MYIYFSKNGSIKEIVNDEALRQGNNNTNVVYCYFEGTTLLSFSRVDFSILRNGDTSAITYTEDNDSPITAQVPYNADRELLNFKYYTDYPFHKYTLTSTNLAVNGVIKITITAYDTNDKVFAMGLYIGQVENGVLNYDTDITEAQYQSLLNMLAQHARWTDIENYVGATREQVATKTNFMQYYNAVRVYETLALANADIANLALLSVVLIKNESDNYDLYRKNDATTLAKVSSQDFVNLYNASIKSITNTLVDGVLTTQLLKENNTALGALIDLKNAFYLKSQVYTKQECDNLFLTIQAMSQYATKDYVNSTFATISALSDTNTLAQSAYDLASSKANTYVFDTYDLMKADLASASATKYHLGDNLLIVALDTPDYWVKKVNATQSGDYGYYELAEQEVNLQGYQKKTDNSLITTDKTIVGAINETLNIANSIPIEQQIDLTGVFSTDQFSREYLNFSTAQTYELVNGKKYILNMSYGSGVYEDSVSNPFVYLHINGGTQYIRNPLYSRNARYKDIEQVKVSIATLYTMRWVFECFYYESEDVGYFYIPTTISNQDIIKVSYFHENDDITDYRIGQVIFDIGFGKFWVVGTSDLDGTIKIAREITLPYLTSISVATESALGGIKAKALTNEQNTQEVLISGEKLYSQATPIATSTIAGSVKVADKTGSGSFVEVMIDSTGKLYCPTIPTLQFTIVSTLPTTGESNIIYLVPTTSSSTNNYDEYIWVNNKRELLGGVAIDLTNYYTKSEIDTKVSALNNADLLDILYTAEKRPDGIKIHSTWTYKDMTTGDSYFHIDNATDTTAGLLTNTQNIKLNALPTADKVAQKFVINGTITNSVVAFNSLVVADLISAITNNSVIIFKATNTDIQDFIINTQKTSGTTYTLIGNYTINNSGVITNYELTITIVDNVANGSISIVSGASVASADYASANTQLNGIKINDTNYKLLDVKVNDGDSLIIGNNRSLASEARGVIAIGDCVNSVASGIYSTALGSGSRAGGIYSTAIGSFSMASSNSSTALGNNSIANADSSIALGSGSKASGYYSTALGSGSKVYVPNWVSFDGINDYVRTVSLKSTDNIFFRNENVDTSKTTQASYTDGKTLTQVLNTKQDTLVSGTNIKTINGNSLLGSGDVSISGSGGSGSGSDKLVRISILGITNAPTGGNVDKLVFVGYHDLINTALETMGLNLDTLSANWKTLMTGEQATTLWAGLVSFLSDGLCFSCTYTINDDDAEWSVSPIMSYNYLGYIDLLNGEPRGHVVFALDTALKAAFANSSMMLND